MLTAAHRTIDKVEMSSIKKDFVAMIGELVGTIFFLYIALAATSFANQPISAATGTGNVNNASNVLYISLAFGFSLAINAWIFFRVSGGLFNPAITLGLMVMGVVPVGRGILLIIAQLAGGIIAALMVREMFPTPFYAETLLREGTTVVQGLFIEVILTAQLIMAIFMLAVEKSKATYLAPIGIGIAFFISELAGVYFTGGSLNPARTLGPAVANYHFPHYFWIYWIGPLVGALLASGFYAILRSLEYQTVMPDQDAEKSASAPPATTAAASPDLEKDGRRREAVVVADSEKPQRRRSVSSASTTSLTPGRYDEMKLPDW